MTELERLHMLDAALIVFSKKLHLTQHLTPINVAEQRAIFLEQQGDYDPQFTYTFPSEESLHSMIHQLQALHKDYFSETSYTKGVAKLLQEKIHENILKAELILAYSKQDRDRIDQLNHLLFGAWNEDILEKARQLHETYRHPPASLRGDKLTAQQVQTLVSTYKTHHHLDELSIEMRSGTPSKFLMQFSDQGAQLIFDSHLIVREYTLQADLLHELGIHYARYQAGKQSGRHILTYGTANYLATEEGLAIHQVVEYKRKIAPTFEKIGIYQKYMFLHDMVAKSARDMVGYLEAHEITHNHKVMFDLILRSKMGVQDCSIRHAGNTFPQMKVYADGYYKVLAWLAQGHTPAELMRGKIKIEDLASLAG